MCKKFEFSRSRGPFPQCPRWNPLLMLTLSWQHAEPSQFSEDLSLGCWAPCFRVPYWMTVCSYTSTVLCLVIKSMSLGWGGQLGLKMIALQVWELKIWILKPSTGSWTRWPTQSSNLERQRQGSQSKLARKTSHTYAIWVFLKDPGLPQWIRWKNN